MSIYYLVGSFFHRVPLAESAHRNMLHGDTKGKKATAKFGPLKAVLEAIPAIYANHEVR